MAHNKFIHIAEKIEHGERLSREDGITLINSNDILALGQLANAVKEKKTGNYAYFNVNRHINLTNICVSRCKFCALAGQLDPDAYAMTLDEVLAIAGLQETLA